MGYYLYKINPKAQLIAGQIIHVATYAFKPYGRAAQDDTLRRVTGCDRVEKAWRVAPEGPILVAYKNKGKFHDGTTVHLLGGGTGGVIDDESLSLKPVVGYLRKVRGRWTFEPKKDA